MQLAVWEQKAETALWWIALVLILVTPALTGVIGTASATILLILYGLYTGVRHGWDLWFRDRYALLLVVAFALIAIGFVVTARQPQDLIYIVNFLGILAGPPLLHLAKKNVGLDWTRRIVLMVAAGIAIMLVISLFFVLFEDLNRARGLLAFGPNRLGQFALMFGAICLGGMMVWRTAQSRALLIAATILSVVCIILADSRGVAIAAIPVLLIAIGFGIHSGLHRRRMVIAAVVLLLAAGSLVWVTRVSEDAASRILQVTDDLEQVLEEGYSNDSNIQIRLVLYTSGIESFAASPLIGVGWKQALENGNAAVEVDEHLTRRAQRRDYPLMHSDIIAFGASFGLVGLAAFGLMIAAPWLGLAGNDSLKRFRLYVLLTSVCAFHVFALTDVSLSFDMSILLYVLLGALICGTFRDDAPTVQTTA